MFRGSKKRITNRDRRERRDADTSNPKPMSRRLGDSLRTMSEEKPARKKISKLKYVAMLPIVLALKPLAEKFLTSWVRRQVTKWVGMAGGATSGGAAVAEQYEVAIVTGAVAIIAMALELTASWLADKARGGVNAINCADFARQCDRDIMRRWGIPPVLLLLLACLILLTLPGCTWDLGRRGLQLKVDPILAFRDGGLDIGGHVNIGRTPPEPDPEPHRATIDLGDPKEPLEVRPALDLDAPFTGEVIAE